MEFAHDRQALCDPAAQAYYLECLQVITEDRQTEQLQMKLATLQSQDVVSRRDLRAAYRFLNIQLRDASDVSDARVVELFQAQQPDLGVAAQEEARSHLYKIGVSRNSTLIINASRQSVETYEDALSWLGNGVDKNTPDEGILAVLAIKVSNSFARAKRCCLATLAERNRRQETAKQTKRSVKKRYRPSRKRAKVTCLTIGFSLDGKTVIQ